MICRRGRGGGQEQSLHLSTGSALLVFMSKILIMCHFVTHLTVAVVSGYLCLLVCL